MLFWMLGCMVQPIKAVAISSAEGSPGDTGTVETTSSSTPWLSLSDLQADVGADGLWTPGETLLLSVVIQNNWSDDYLWYPGAILSTSSPSVTLPEPGGDWRYALLGHTEDTLQLSVTANSDVSSTIEVELSVELNTLGCESEGEHCVDPQVLPYNTEIFVGG